MSKDYYEILGITREATKSDIAKGYRKLALKWHPKLSKEDSNTTYYHFSLISEAYEVLCDEVKKAFYDKFGEEKLKEGFFEKGALQGGYQFRGNPEEIFERMFGSENPYAHLFDEEGKEEFGTMFGYAFGGMKQKPLESLPPLIVPVHCTLNELYCGCLKPVTYARRKLRPDGRTTVEVSEEKLIEIKAGACEDDRIVFSKQGNEAAGIENSELIFLLKQKHHSFYTRKGKNLIYKAKVCLADALCATPVEISSLDGRTLRIAIDEVINPHTIKIVKGEGMKFPNGTKGDLHLHFEVIFPKFIPAEAKSAILELLPRV